MGLSSLAVVMGIIGQVYAIDFQINQLYQQKLKFSKCGQALGLTQTRIAGVKGGTDPQKVAVQLMDFKSDAPRIEDRHLTNFGGRAHFLNPDGTIDGPVAAEYGILDRPITTEYGRMVNQGTVASASQTRINDPNPQALDAGQVYMSKEEAEALTKSYLAEINQREKEIDMKLEELKARRTALNTQREEFTKYVGEGIKTAFKNNYA